MFFAKKGIDNVYFDFLYEISNIMVFHVKKNLLQCVTLYFTWGEFSSFGIIYGHEIGLLGSPWNHNQ